MEIYKINLSILQYKILSQKVIKNETEASTLYYDDYFLCISHKNS